MPVGHGFPAGRGACREQPPAPPPPVCRQSLGSRDSDSRVRRPAVDVTPRVQTGERANKAGPLGNGKQLGHQGGQSADRYHSANPENNAE